MRFFRISRARFDQPALAFNGEGAMRYQHRWSRAATDLRAVYCSDSLALACLEMLVHLRPLPRIFPRSVYYTVDLPDRLLSIPPADELPVGWDDEPMSGSSMDYGTAFLRARTMVGLVVPTAIQPLGQNVMINPLHPAFDLSWVSGPFPYPFDQRLE